MRLSHLTLMDHTHMMYALTDMALTCAAAQLPWDNLGTASPDGCPYLVCSAQQHCICIIVQPFQLLV